jgi:hypothetical protein
MTEVVPKSGALYSVDDGEGFIRIAKILVMDGEGVHIRLYKNKFTSRPSDVEPASLDLGSIYDSDGFGMGQLPLSHAAFEAWTPIYLRDDVVREDELDGYREWQSARGGHFGPRAH